MPTPKISSVQDAAATASEAPVTAAGAMPRTGRRQQKLARLAKASTLTFTVEPAVRRFLDAQAKAEGMDLTHFMQKLVDNHVLSTAAQDDPLAQRLTAKRAVIDAAVTLAKQMDAEGAFDAHFILTVVRKAAEDPTFQSNYDIAVTGAGMSDKAAQRARVSLNQQLGRLIKKAAGAKSKRGPGGAIIRAQVQDALISTYTLLVKPS